jgi:hypothetical protein
VTARPKPAQPVWDSCHMFAPLTRGMKDVVAMEYRIVFAEVLIPADQIDSARWEIGRRLRGCDLVEECYDDDGGSWSAPIGHRDAVITGYGPIRTSPGGSYYPLILRGVGPTTRRSGAEAEWARRDARRHAADTI